MAVYKTITINPSTQLYIWKIEESIEDLNRSICLTDNCRRRTDLIKLDQHKRQFLSIRHLLKEAGYDPEHLHYNENGKPHLTDGNSISITHSHNFSGIIIGNQNVGIDIEKRRDKILRIAHRFTPLSEYRTLANEEAVIRKLTIVWGAKEAIYKMMNIKGLSFLNDIYVEDFDFDAKETIAEVDYYGKKYSFKVNFLEFEGFTCVYALSSST